jgi:hypothetical protein
MMPAMKTMKKGMKAMKAFGKQKSPVGESSLVAGFFL